jgi:hypothetical protein
LKNKQSRHVSFRAVGKCNNDFKCQQGEDCISCPHDCNGKRKGFCCVGGACSNVKCTAGRWECIKKSPTRKPKQYPTRNPRASPNYQPTIERTISPTNQPIVSLTFQPTSIPSHSPTIQPTSIPSYSPTFQPTSTPSHSPTFQPTSIPSHSPTFQPTSIPSHSPTFQPTSIPSHSPTFQPTSIPSHSPTFHPTIFPSKNPTLYPTITTIPQDYKCPVESSFEDKRIVCDFIGISDILDCFKTESLYFNEDRGPIPTQIGLLSNVDSLGIYVNNQPSVTAASLPNSIGCLTKLTYLSIIKLGLRGALSSTMASVTKLHYSQQVGRYNSIHIGIAYNVAIFESR